MFESPTPNANEEELIQTKTKSKAKPGQGFRAIKGVQLVPIDIPIDERLLSSRKLTASITVICIQQSSFFNLEEGFMSVTTNKCSIRYQMGI